MEARKDGGCIHRSRLAGEGEGLGKGKMSVRGGVEGRPDGFLPTQEQEERWATKEGGGNKDWRE